MMVRRITKLARLTAALLACVAGAAPLAAADLVVPVPTIILYPGNAITDDVLIEREVSIPNVAVGTVVESRAGLVGKVARRTLLPGKAIPLIGVAEPKVVVNGAQVRITFEEGGLTITTYATALQAGGVGEIIKLRNPQSGLILSGTVQADGSVRIGDS
jgi:flagellar basal body P-ring formation protein FlgA